MYSDKSSETMTTKYPVLLFQFVKTKERKAFQTQVKYNTKFDTLDDLKILKGMKTLLRSHQHFKIAPSSISFRKIAVALKSAVLSSH